MLFRSVELAILAVKTFSVEDTLRFLIKNQCGYWEHNPILKEDFIKKYCPKKCLICTGRIKNPTKELVKERSDFNIPFNALKTVNGYLMHNQIYKEDSKCNQVLVIDKPKKNLSDYSLTKSKIYGPRYNPCELSLTTEDDDRCYICGDVFSMHKYEDHNYDIEELITNEYKNNICLICIETYNDIYTLYCNHRYCMNCLNGYFSQCIEENHQIICPSTNCNFIIPAEIITRIIEKRKYEEYLIKLDVLMLGSHAYCPVCSTINQIPISDEPMVQCVFCLSIFCAKCLTYWHKDKTCNEFMEFWYKNLCKGREYQLCPQCKSVVRRSSQCGHMICSHCLLTFCIMCRIRVSDTIKGKVDNCPLHRITTYPRSRCNKLVCIVISLLCLIVYLAITPFLALFLVPYIVGINIFDHYCEVKERSVDLMSSRDESQRMHNNGLSSSNIYMRNTSKLQVNFNKYIMRKSNVKVLRITMMYVIAAFLLSPITIIGLIIIGLVIFTKVTINC